MKSTDKLKNPIPKTNRTTKGSNAPKPATGGGVSKIPGKISTPGSKPKPSPTTPKVAPRTGRVATGKIGMSKGRTITTPGFKPTPKKPEFR